MIFSQRSLTAVAVTVVMAFASIGYSDTYTQHTQATIGDITSQTVATTPADRTRTTIGIGEEVTCSIDPGTWVDKDCNVTQSTVEDDTIGTKQWAASGAGTVVPTTAGAYDSCTLTAHQSPGTVVVEVTIKDSLARYNDTVTKQKTFSVIAPNGQNAAHSQDGPHPNRTQNAAGTFIGASSEFTATLTSSSPVNFQKAVIAENIPQTSWTWPDSNTASWGPYNYHTGYPGYVAFTYVTPGLNASNEWTDTRRWLYSDSLNKRTYLDGLTGSFHAPMTIHMEYKNQSDNWVQFFNGTNDGGDQGFEYTGPGDTCNAKMKGSSGDAVGNQQGPWTSP